MFSRILTGSLAAFAVFCALYAGPRGSFADTASKDGLELTNDLEFAIQAENPRDQHVLVSIAVALRALRAGGNIEWDFDEDREGRSPNFVFVSMPGAFVDGRLNPKSVDFIDAPWIDELLDTEVNTETCFIQRIIPPSIDRRSVFAFHNDDNEDVDSIYRCFTLALSVFLQDRTDLNLEDWRREVSKLFQNY